MKFLLRIFQPHSTALRLLGMVLLAAITATSPVQASDRQHKVEAAFLYNFFSYITWPGYDSPKELETPTICIYGNDPILPYLEYVRQKAGNERNLAIRVTKTRFKGCHLLFIRHVLPYRLLNTLDKKILTVFEPDDPLDRGGMIELTEEEERISLRINQRQLEQHGFQASSRLLELALRAR